MNPQVSSSHSCNHQDYDSLDVQAASFNYYPAPPPIAHVVPQEPYTAISGRTAVLALQNMPWTFEVNGRPGISVERALQHDTSGLLHADERLKLPPQDDLGDKMTIRIRVRSLLCV
jgi:hypothetical protein